MNRFVRECPESASEIVNQQCRDQFYSTEVARLESVTGASPVTATPSLNAADAADDPPVTPTPRPTVLQAEPPPTLSCDSLRLTAPLDGLPNGMTTFYWNPVPNATSFNVSLHDGPTFLAGFSADGSATNLSANVSQSAIGGSYSITMVLTATGANGDTCSTGVTVFREAPQPVSNNENSSDNATSTPAPTLAPTPTADPCDSDYGSYPYCDGGEFSDR